MDGSLIRTLSTPAILGGAAVSLAAGAFVRQCWCCSCSTETVEGGSNTGHDNSASARKPVIAGSQLVFVTGASGSGKTTLGEALRQYYGFVHIDGDRWTAGLNPVSDGLPPSQEELQTEVCT